MASEKILQEKQAYVAQLKEKISGSVAGVLVDYKGINVADDTKLRKELREANVEYKVIKNTMLRLALDGTGYESLTEHLSNTTALAVSAEDPISAAKILNKYAEASKGKFSLKAGFMEGNVLDEAGVKQIASLPGKEELLCMLCSALNGNIRGLAVALNAIAEKGEDSAEAAAE